eukprot:GEMP01030643.1.p1 GENE.GEMP01030643.1~~GEMP01030643.1.p1  ORF type:complete len:499 (-),score=145.46 GEMP01030643.1:629-2125(-)
MALPCMTVRYLSGDAIELDHCQTFFDVKLELARRHDRLLPEVVIVRPTHAAASTQPPSPAKDQPPPLDTWPTTPSTVDEQGPRGTVTDDQPAPITPPHPAGPLQPAPQQDAMAAHHHVTSVCHTPSPPTRDIPRSDVGKPRQRSPNGSNGGNPSLNQCRDAATVGEVAAHLGQESNAAAAAVGDDQESPVLRDADSLTTSGLREVYVILLELTSPLRSEEAWMTALMAHAGINDLDGIARAIRRIHEDALTCDASSAHSTTKDVSKHASPPVLDKCVSTGAEASQTPYAENDGGAKRGVMDDMKSMSGVPSLVVTDAQKNAIVTRALLRYMYGPQVHTAIVRLLLDKRAEADGPVGVHWATPLRLAARRGENASVRIMLAAPGTKVNRIDEDGFPPLYWAVLGGSAAVVETLLKTKAKVNITWNHGSTALHEAVIRNSCPVAETLVRHDADINMSDRQGQSPLVNAIESFNHGMAQTLLGGMCHGVTGRILRKNDLSE